MRPPRPRREDDRHASDTLSAHPVDTRRDFLRRSVAALIVGPTLLPAFTKGTPARTESASLTLKTKEQYESEASELKRAMEAFAAAVASTPGAEAALAAYAASLTSQVAIAAPKVALFYSWMVATCAADPALTSWVRKEIRDKATFDKFVEQVKRDPNSVNSISGVDRLRSLIRQTKAQQASIHQQLITKLASIAHKTPPRSEVNRLREVTQECMETWAIVAAILVIAMAAVVASTSFGAAAAIAAGSLSAAYIVAAAAAIAARYAGTGAERVEQDMKAATEAYNQCLIAATTKPPSEQSQAMADCQAQYLAAQMAALL